MLQLQRARTHSTKLPQTPREGEGQSNNRWMDERREEGDAGDVEKGGFSGGAGVKRTSSSPWTSVNYFTPRPLEVRMEPEPETVPEQSLKVEKEREKETKKSCLLVTPGKGPYVATAEWVLWKMHQN